MSKTKAAETDLILLDDRRSFFNRNFLELPAVLEMVLVCTVTSWTA